MDTWTDAFIGEVEAFLAESGMGPTNFGKETTGSGGFVTALRGGKSPTLRTVDQIRAWMAKWRKENAA